MTHEGEYEPTTEVVEGRYVSGHGKYTRKSFRRWLAARDAAVRAVQIAKDARIVKDLRESKNWVANWEENNFDAGALSASDEAEAAIRAQLDDKNQEV